MKTKYNRILTLLLAFMVQLTFAQEKTISGVVSDELGPVSDATVTVKNTKLGVVTDFDGNYTIKAKTGDTLVFTHVSYSNNEKIVGSSNTINVTMSSTGTFLEEVIVNAIGLKKKKINDLSSATKIDVDVVERSGESGLLQGLAGKTSGVNIIKSSGDPGAGSFIQIRGANTISNGDQPLIVLDGVLISNTNNGGGTAGVAASSRLNDIPASDIESVTILKGAQAAAIYGSAAAGGVIVITTKSGKGTNGKSWSVNLKSSFQVEKISEYWDLQSKFGQGVNGIYSPAGNRRNSFGDRISDRSGAADDVDTSGEYFLSESGKFYYPIISKNSTELFNESNKDLVLGTGFTSAHDISISNSNENGNTYLSFSNWDQKGIIKNNSDYNRSTIRFNNTTKFGDKLTGKVSATYITSKNNLIQQGSNLNGLYLGLLRTPVDFDNTDYVGTRVNNQGNITQNAHRAFRNYLGTAAVYNNPLWTINKQSDLRKLNRFLISPELTYKFNDNISLVARYSIDHYSQKSQSFQAVNSSDTGANGSFTKTDGGEKQEYAIVILTGRNELTDKVKLDWSIGANYEKNVFESIGGTVNNFINPFVTLGDLEAIGGGFAVQEDQQLTNNIFKEASNGAFATLDFEFMDQFLLGLSGRVDRSSTLIDETFFFPSASFGWKFSENIKDKNFLSFGKLRLTYGEVATAPQPYRLNTTFQAQQVGSSWGDVLTGSVYGGLFNTDANLGNPNLDIERVKEYEIGTDLRLFKNRIDLGITYYNRVTESALVDQSISPSTGYTSITTNTAELSNKGIEVDLGLKVIDSDDFFWKLNFNFSKNKSMVDKLPGGDVFLAGFTGTSSEVREGEAFGVLIGGAFEEDDNGNLVLDDNGFPMADDDGDQVIGDPNADWRGGVNSLFKWKNFTLTASVEAVQGQDIWNGTQGVLDNFGRSTRTANEVTVSAADAATIVNYAGQSIDQISYAQLNSDGSYTVRGNLEDFGSGTVLLDQRWYTSLGGGFGPVDKQFVEDGSFVKLREVTLGYDFNKQFLKNIGVSNVNFSVSGRNLVTWTGVDGFDPEGNLTGATKGRGLEYFTNPPTRSYIFTLKIGF